MYHIKPDKRSQTSAQLIVDGLYACLKSKSFSSVTISDIQRASTVSRATFYRLFDNLADVLEYECNNVFRTMLDRFKDNPDIPKGVSPFEALFTFFMEYWMNHTDLLNAMLSSNRIDIMISVFMSHTEQIKEILVPNMDLPTQQLDYFVSVATASIFGMFYTWIARGKKETGKELIEALKNSIKIVEISLETKDV